MYYGTVVTIEMYKRKLIIIILGVIKKLMSVYLLMKNNTS